MPLRILHVATRHRVGGAERNLLHTVARELERDFEVHVAVGTDQLHSDFPPQARLHRLPELVRQISPPADRRALEDLRRLIYANRFDVVQTHQSKAGALGRMAARGSAPVVVHTVHMASFGSAYGRLRSAMFLCLERWLARFTHRFVFVGSALQRRYLAAGIDGADRSMIVRSPVAELESLLELRSASPDQRRRAQAEIGVPAGRRTVLAVAALDRRKRHDVAIRRLIPLLADGEAHLVIAGQGPEREPLERLCHRLGIARSVQFAGFVPDVRRLYAAADVLVHTSELEGVPQAVVQAVAAGVPVVATDVDGIREVSDDPRHVSVLPPDARGLAELVRARLGVDAPPPAPPAAVRRWLPETVDRDLGELHEWMESRVWQRRSSADDVRRLPPAPAGRPEAGEPVLG